MSVDRSNALVTITLEGLLVICKNDRINPPRWEVGVPLVSDKACGPHNFTVRIFKITGSGNRVSVPDPNDPDNNGLLPNRTIEITNNVSDPALPVEFYPQSGSFSRSDEDDPHDYRWLVDLESREFHDEGVSARPDVARHHKLKIFIDGGQLYTLDKSVEDYKRFTSAQDVLHLRKLGLSIGIDLPRGENNVRTVTLRNKGMVNDILLEQEIGVRYEVELKHVCSPSDEPSGIDFDLYYEIFSPNDGTQFYIITESAPIPDDPTHPPRGGNEPQVCNSILLGQNQRLPGNSSGSGTGPE